ncbi:flagellar hook-associated protein 3 FlgL [Noviherbaspirillum humi]|uniref:Flagellar hook-associated protein 3 FlgL n=1 Tax=Noviherbaspirillum humi TaxID=1688639 RepID=A0A239FYB8_9BURK|nr:flagellar hook-associated protein FlgL [Noviherbaspirillum humi]SNS61183.1 flagellar hook-associated protein 3 FlgL [Noviherbaspirillum humi]
MRISTATIYDSAASRMGELQNRLVKGQQQMATGKRIMTASDDPIAAGKVLSVSQSKSVNEQLGINRQNARTTLSFEETALAGVTEALQDVSELIVNAGNGAYNDSQRQDIANALRARQQQLIGLANSKDQNGNYLFSGYQINVPPFSQNASGTSYVGDQGQRILEVAAGRTMAINDNGYDVFEGVATASGGATVKQNMFKTLDDMINLLQTPTANNPAAQAALQSGLKDANTNVSTMLDRALSVRASVGHRLKELDTLDDVGSAMDIQFATTLSDLQDLDYTQAISKFSQDQITLQAAQQSFMKVTGMSLFQYL